jgi:hypothetical protein
MEHNRIGKANPEIGDHNISRAVATRRKIRKKNKGRYSMRP